MVSIRYRRKIALLKLLAALLFVIAGVWLIYMIPTAGFIRQILTVIAIILAFGFFGQYLFLFSYFLFKPSTEILKYDRDNIYYKDQVISFKEIEKTVNGYIPRKTLPGGVPGFRFKLKNGELFEVPTYHLFMVEEFAEYDEKLEKLVLKNN